MNFRIFPGCNYRAGRKELTEVINKSSSLLDEVSPAQSSLQRL